MRLPRRHRADGAGKRAGRSLRRRRARARRAAAAAKLPLHLLAAFVICFAAFFRGDWKKTLLCCGLFIAANALMGGLLTAVYTLSGKYAHYNGGFYAEIAPEASSPSRWRARSARGCSASSPNGG